jgi:hypothetical protein
VLRDPLPAFGYGTDLDEYPEGVRVTLGKRANALTPPISSRTRAIPTIFLIITTPVSILRAPAWCRPAYLLALLG